MNAEQAIKVGMSRQEAFQVEEQHSAAHLGSGTVKVLATPWMIAFMEITARKLLDEHLPDSHTSVGTHVDVHHLAACGLGSQVQAQVEVLGREGRRVMLSVRLLEEDREIGAGKHERVIVDKEKILARVQK